MTEWRAPERVEMLSTKRVARVGAAVFAAFALWVLGGWSEGSTLKAVDDVVLIVVAIPAVLSAALAARSAHGRLRIAWLAMTIGLICWLVGEVIWTYYELTPQQAPFPSAADVAYLMMPVGTGIALLMFPGDYSGQSRIRLLLDAVIITGSLFLVGWVTILGPMQARHSGTTLEFAISLAYPASDLVIVALAAMVLVKAATDQRLALTLLTAGLACIALSDSIFAYLANENRYVTGSAADIGWVAGLLLITVAATVAREGRNYEETLDQLPLLASIWLPYVPLLLAGVLLVVEPRSPFLSGPLEVTGVVLVIAVLVRQFLFLSENRRLLATVSKQALHDPLTGLANRTLFNDRLDHALSLREREGLSVGLIALDLNDFKLVNDTLGHPAGDALLVETADRLNRCVRTGDTVARLGGDEFAVLVEDRADHSQAIAQRVVEAFKKPFVIEGRQVLVHPSVGLAVADDLPVSAEELHKQADMAMYSAKRSQAGGVHRFNADMELADSGHVELFRGRVFAPPAGGPETIQLLGELRRAIADFELTLVYQPKFDLRTSRVVGVEALVRWPHPRRGLLGPNEFLPMVRYHGLMGSITEIVVNKALDDAVAWRSESVAVPVAVNIFAPSLADRDLPDRIGRALSERALDSNALTLEITEDLLLGNMESTQDVLNRLRQKGIRISIDDFGSGYSALFYLRDLPVDEVKLDHSFVTPIANDPRAAAVLRAVVYLGRELGLTTVAEGVENAETAEMLREFGCDVVQGYYYSRPMPSEQLVALLKSWKPNATDPSESASARSS